MPILYDIFYIVFLIFYLPVFILKRKFHKNFSMRFGKFPDELINCFKSRDIIWIHAVSVGEVNSAESLIRGLRKLHPDKSILISTVTETGNRAAKKITKDDELVIYLPLDLSFIVKRVIRLIKPEIFIIVETEIWPNLIASLSQQGIPIVLINGRLSLTSYRRYTLIEPLVRSIFGKINLLCMQTEEDALRIINLGAPPDNVKITGNTKFDIDINLENLEKEITQFREMLRVKNGDQVLIAGSTHYPEEKILFSLYKKIQIKHPSFKMIIAPRHTERLKNIKREIEDFGLKWIKFSELNRRTFFDSEPRVILIDIMGKLKTLYALATVVFVGGSLAKIGGHNMIEPAMFSKPIIFGPYVYNFQVIAEDLLANNAAYMVRNQKQLGDKIDYLLANPEQRKQLGQNARRILEHSRGASNKVLNYISDLMNS